MNHEIRALFKKYADDQCSADELQLVQRLLRSGSYLKEWASVMEEDALNLADKRSNADNSHAFDSHKILRRINSKLEKKSSLYNSKWAMGIAASLLLCFFAGSLFLKNISPLKNHEVFSAISTQAGEQKIVMLSDGSRIVLNNQSKVTYPAAFSGKKREVYLQGEAFFDIKHDVAHPFIVHAGKLNVHVLGTSFNVKAYAKERNTTVSVATGKVGVTNSQMRKADFLLPNQQLQYDTQGAFRKMPVTSDDIMGWQNGTLIFKQETIADIILVLQRRYNVSIEVSHPALLQKQITGRFQNRALVEILPILAQTGGFTFTINNNHVVINN